MNRWSKRKSGSESAVILLAMLPMYAAPQHTRCQALLGSSVDQEKPGRRVICKDNCDKTLHKSYISIHSDEEIQKLSKQLRIRRLAFS